MPLPTAAPPANPTSDVLLRGRYVLEAKIGEGGTSVVYRARDLRRDAAAPGGQRVALKLLRPGLRNHPRAVERLKREFHHAQTLSHPAIARVYDVDCDGGAWFLTLELLDGESLAEVLDRAEPVTPRRALDILRACGEALAFAHERGVVHGDFKPGNVFITATGQVRVLDFGSASASWLAGEAIGTTATPAYASPEVLSGQRAERRDDIFSFACMAYEVLCGRHPFDRHSSLEARNAGRLPDRDWNLSPRQWTALESGLAYMREERPTNVRAMLADLTSADAPVPIVLPDIREPTARFRSPALAPLSAFAALAALGAVILIANSQLEDLPSVPEVMDRTEQVARDLANLPPLGQSASSAKEQAAGAKAPPSRSAARPAESRPAANSPRAAAAAALPSGANERTDTAVEEPSSSAEDSEDPFAPLDQIPLNGVPTTGGTQQPQSGDASLAAQDAETDYSLGSSALVSFDVGAISVSEGANSAVLRINRRHQLTGRAAVQWRTLAGSARPNEDFREIARGIAEFADGQTTRAIYIPLLNDLNYEPDENFTVELYSPDGMTRINPIPRVQVTVRDNDSANEYRLAEQPKHP